MMRKVVRKFLRSMDNLVEKSWDVGKLQCALCGQIVWKPVCCQHCQRLFCAKCITLYVHYRKLCICLTSFKCAPCHTLDSQLTNLHFFCPKAGCLAFVPYLETEKHMAVCAQKDRGEDSGTQARAYTPSGKRSTTPLQRGQRRNEWLEELARSLAKLNTSEQLPRSSELEVWTQQLNPTLREALSLPTDVKQAQEHSNDGTSDQPGDQSHIAMKMPNDGVSNLTLIEARSSSRTEDMGQNNTSTFTEDKDTTLQTETGRDSQHGRAKSVECERNQLGQASHIKALACIDCRKPQTKDSPATEAKGDDKEVGQTSAPFFKKETERAPPFSPPLNAEDKIKIGMPPVHTNSNSEGTGSKVTQLPDPASVNKVIEAVNKERPSHAVLAMSTSEQSLQMRNKGSKENEKVANVQETIAAQYRKVQQVAVHLYQSKQNTATNNTSKETVKAMTKNQDLEAKRSQTPGRLTPGTQRHRSFNVNQTLNGMANPHDESIAVVFCPLANTKSQQHTQMCLHPSPTVTSPNKNTRQGTNATIQFAQGVSRAKSSSRFAPGPDRKQMHIHQQHKHKQKEAQKQRQRPNIKHTQCPTEAPARKRDIPSICVNLHSDSLIGCSVPVSVKHENAKSPSEASYYTNAKKATLQLSHREHQQHIQMKENVVTAYHNKDKQQTSRTIVIKQAAGTGHKTIEINLSSL